MDDLVLWLGEQLDEDERIARRATVRQAGGGSWAYDESDVQAESGLGVARRIVPVHGEHIARHDPARVLREIDAKRQIIAPYSAALAEREAIRARMREVIYKEPDEFARLHRQESRLIESAEALAPVVVLLALPYADRPGYQESWRP